MSFLDELMQGSFFSVTSRSVGSFNFDVVTSESHESELRVTENPVESGALIADHSILEPKSVTIEAVMVSYEPPNFAQNKISEMFGVDLGMLNQLPIPMEISALTNQALAMANRYIGGITNALNTLARPLAPWLPDFALDFLNDMSPSSDRVGKALAELEKLQKSGETFEVQTGIRSYKDMVLIAVGVYQVDDYSAQFTLTLREIHIVETQTAEGLDVKSPKSNRSKNQSAPAKQKGNTQPKNKGGGKGASGGKSSVLHGMLGKL